METMQSSLLIDRDALFCDETGSYRNPAEPEAGERVNVFFRTAQNNADSVYLITGRTQIKMQKAEIKPPFDYYKAQIPLGSEPAAYYFEAVRGNETCCYDKAGPGEKDARRHCFLMTPGFHTPQWAKGAVIYQIYTDRFCNGSKDNDVLTGEYSYIHQTSECVTDWDSIPADLDVCRFYGGDLQGVEAKLDYLQYLGIEVIYFNPLFVSPSNHKYDSQDYDHIDPHFAVITKDEGELLPEGEEDNRKAARYISRVTSQENLEASNAYFASLVEKIHARGMRVILDGVFNHCGSFNKWMDRERIYENQPGYAPGAYVSADSPYRHFFDFSEGGTWPYNGRYDGWWQHDTLPKLNYEASQELYDYILRIGQKWVSPPYNVDGWRLDVAADLGHSETVNHRFWRDFRRAVKDSNPDALILAEHYGDPSSWIEGDEWDTVMNYDAFMEPVTWFLTGMEKHSDEFREELYGDSEWFFRTMAVNMSKFQRCSLDVAMNELSNHDHSRFLTRTNRTVGRLAKSGAKKAGEGIQKSVLREAVVMQMTMPGAPTLYYADEAGQVGWTDPDNRRTYPWGKEDWELIEFHRDMIRIHKRLACLKTGSYKPLTGGRHWLAYGRFCPQGQAIIVINNSLERLQLRIPVWQAEVEDGAQLLRVMQSTANGYNVGAACETVKDGMLEVSVGAQTASVYVGGDEKIYFEK